MSTDFDITKLRAVFGDACVKKSSKNEASFQGRNLPAFVKDYIIRRFSNSDGAVDGSLLKNYLETKISTDQTNIKSRLLRGENINITTRVIFKPIIKDGLVAFEIPDAGITADAFVSMDFVNKNPNIIFDGEQWGNLTLVYQLPDKHQKGYISITSFKPFEPYKIDLDYYIRSRKQYSLEEWIDLLITVMGYNPPKNNDLSVKIEYVTRLLPFVEPRLNLIELGPKSTGKSHLYNNFSKRGWCISGGKISRAKLFYNISVRKFGLLKHYDVVAIDEISSFSFVDPDEMQSAFKSYLEAGKCSVDNTSFQSECGLVLMGNITLDDNLRPINESYYEALPKMLQESATLDRFHSFIEGWKLPRLEVGAIYEGWSLDVEYFSSILHTLRSEGTYSTIFDEIVEFDSSADLRDMHAVKKVATAYTKILFPHVKSLAQLSPEAQIKFKEAYNTYCLQPAVRRRAIIRKQCHFLDKEFTEKIPEFKIKADFI